MGACDLGGQGVGPPWEQRESGVEIFPTVLYPVVSRVQVKGDGWRKRIWISSKKEIGSMKTKYIHKYLSVPLHTNTV